MQHRARSIWFLAAFGALAFVGLATADEGMWPFDRPPLQQIRQRYGVTLTPEWLDRLRLASVRLNMGSASFVSPNGLILTNHHVAAECIQNLSTEKTDYLAAGYGVREKLPEKKCPGLEAQTLIGYDDVTQSVAAAIPAGAGDAAAAPARRAALANLEKACSDKTGLTCEAVTMYGGGEYWIYRYRTYRDVRLVFAPEMRLAFFGGNSDNFNFPRFCLDFAFLRAYDEQGQPVKPPAFLKPRLHGVKENDAVFIAGHPAASQRFLTIAQLDFLRTVMYPARLTRLRGAEAALQNYSKKGAEQARRAATLLLYIQNSIKAYVGNLEGLENAPRMAAKRTQEDALRRRVAADPALQKLAGDAWARIADAANVYAAFAARYRLLAYSPSRLLNIAARIVRLAAELPKPNDQRNEEYQESNLPSLFQELYSDAPIYSDLEEALIADFLAELRDAFGPSDLVVQRALQSRTPEAAARQAVRTKLLAPDDRRKLVAGGAAALAAADDPLIALAQALDPTCRELRTRYEEQVRIVEELAGRRIAQARFAAYGKSAYPDATFTLRLSYGRVAGYLADSREIPYRTTFYGLFDRHFGFEGKPPFDLPAAWLARRDKLNLAVSLDHADTAETFGGNSGSPEVDQDGRLVGVVFDGNIESLAIDFLYDDVAARSLSVSVDGVVEALRRVYERDDIVKEFLGE